MRACSLDLCSLRSLIIREADAIARFDRSRRFSEDDQCVLVQFEGSTHTETETSLSSYAVGSWVRAGCRGSANGFTVCARSCRGARGKKGKNPGKETPERPNLMVDSLERDGAGSSGDAGIL